MSAPKLLVELGRGGMGRVYLAARRGPSSFTKLTVVKQLDHELARNPRFLHMFLDEARLAARLHHPNVVQTNDVVREGDAYFIEMEYLEGVSLHEAQPLFEPRIEDGVSLGVFVLTEVLAGLHYAHDLVDFDGRPLRCVHRDVSPPNVVLTYDGGVKLIDFGVAKSADSTFETAEGIAKGKLAFMAPENALGLTLDRRADVFAVGVMLHRMLTGRDLWGKASETEIVHALRDGGIPRLDDVPGVHPMLVSACNRALAWHPDERFESAEAMRLALEWYLEEHAPRVGTRALARSLEAEFGDDRRAFRAEVERLVREAMSSTARRPAVVGSAASAPVTAPVRVPRRSSIPPPSVTPPASSVIVASREHERLLSTVLHLKGTNAAVRALLDSLGPKQAIVRDVADGETHVIVRGRGSARDQAALAARVALMVRRPGLCSALATSVTELADDGKSIVGAAIDAAAKLAHGAEAAHGIVVDSLTMALLESRFVIETVDDVRLLRAARDPDDVDRLVHGRQAPFLGRDDELGVLFDAFATVVAMRVPAVVWTAAEPGLGKSRLFRELKQRLAESPFLPAIWTAAADPLAAGAPYGVVRDLVSRAIGIGLAEGDVQRRAAVRAFVSERVPDEEVTSEFVCELLGIPSDVDETAQLRAARRDTRLMHQQISLAFRDIVVGELERGPLVIACDDAQSLDVPSTKLLESVLDLELPLLVLAFADGPRGKQLTPPRGEAFELTLAPLGKEVTVRLAGALLPAASLQTTESLAEAAAGSPLHLEELVRAYVRGAAPSAVLAMIQARLATVADPARLVLRTASVIGGTFDVSLLSAVLPDLPMSEVSSALDLLVGRELLVERKVPTGRQLSFRNALVREAAHALLPDAERAAIHLRIADRLAEDEGKNPLAVATHLVQAGRPTRAAASFARAALASLAANDVAQAETLVANGERCKPTGEIAGELEAIRAQLSHFRGKNKDIVQHAGRAIELLPRGTARFFDVVGFAAVGAGASGDSKALQRCDGLVREVAPVDEAARVSRLRAILRVAGEMHSHGEGVEADRLLALIDDESKDLLAREPVIAAMRAHVRAGRALARGDNESALGLLLAAADAFDTMGDLRGSCLERCNASYASSELGLAEQAERLARESIAAAERAGIVYVAFGARANLALALIRGGRWRPAMQEIDRVARHALEREDRFLGAASFLYRAIALAGLGDVGAAERDARRCLEADEFPSYVAHARALLARLAVRRRDVAAALEHAREAIAIMERLGGVESGEAMVRLAWAEALGASGRADEASAAIAIARERLNERAGAIREPSVRAAFLGIAEHRDTFGG